MLTHIGDYMQGFIGVLQSMLLKQIFSEAYKLYLTVQSYLNSHTVIQQHRHGYSSFHGGFLGAEILLVISPSGHDASTQICTSKIPSQLHFDLYKHISSKKGNRIQHVHYH